MICESVAWSSEERSRRDSRGCGDAVLGNSVWIERYLSPIRVLLKWYSSGLGGLYVKWTRLRLCEARVERDCVGEVKLVSLVLVGRLKFRCVPSLFKSRTTKKEVTVNVFHRIIECKDRGIKKKTAEKLDSR